MQISSFSERETFILGKRLAYLLRPKDTVCLYGPLGAGKTVLVKGIACGLGIPKEKVISPAFVLINEYKGKTNLYHIDLYRIKNIQELLTTGYEDYLYSDGITVIEWAQRIPDFLMPLNYLKVEFKIIDKNSRKIKISFKGNHYNSILDKLKRLK